MSALLVGGPPGAPVGARREQEVVELQVLQQILEQQDLGDGRLQPSPQAKQQQQAPVLETGFVCSNSDLCGLDAAAAAAAAALLGPLDPGVGSTTTETVPVKAAAGKQRVPCPQCQRTFRYPNEVKKHLEIAHEGLKVACPYCGKAFSTKCNLQKHVAGLHEGKSYPCTECSKVYTDPSNLRKHIRTAHSKVRVACSLCDKTFSQASHMRQHLRSAHEEVRFTCSFPGCGRQYTRNDQLAAHVKLAHGEIAAPLEQETSFESVDAQVAAAASAGSLAEVLLGEDDEYELDEEDDDDDETHDLGMHEEGYGDETLDL